MVAGKSKAGKSTLINNILKNDEESILSLKAGTAEFDTKNTKYNGVTVEFVDTPGLRGGNKSQLKALSKHTKGEADLLVYCLSIGMESSFDADGNPAIMQTLQDVYGTDIWKHCVVVLTFGNLAQYHINLRGAVAPEQFKEKYKEHVTNSSALFRSQLTRNLRVEDVDVKTIFENQGNDSPTTIIAIPAGYDDRDQVLLDIVKEGDREGWKGRVFLEMLKKCRDSNKAALLRYRYGRNLAIKALKESGVVIVGATGGGTALVVGAGIGAAIGTPGGPAGVVAGGLIGAAAGIVAGVIFSGAAAGVKKLRRTEAIPNPAPEEQH